jgi:predicted dehydrogenase
MEQDEGALYREQATVHTYPVVDQYTVMGDAFSLAILEGTEVPVSLEDGMKNTRVLEAIFESAARDQWVAV